MKVSYRLKSGGGYTVLYDSAAVPAFDSGPTGQVAAPALAEWDPEYTYVNRDTKMYKQASSDREAMGNTSARIRLAFCATYATPKDALASHRTMDSLYQSCFANRTLIHLKVEEGAEVQYYPNATVESYKGPLHGRSVDHEVIFSCDGPTNVIP